MVLADIGLKKTVSQNCGFLCNRYPKTFSENYISIDHTVDYHKAEDLGTTLVKLRQTKTNISIVMVSITLD